MKVQFKLIKNGKLPEAATPHAGAYDVYAREIIADDMGFMQVNLGFATAIPEGYRAILIPRSSLTKYNWCIPHGQGLIDSDFRHEWQLRLRPIPAIKPITIWGEVKIETDDDDDYYEEVGLSREEFQRLADGFPYNEGDRIGQFYLEKVIPVDMQVVDELPTSERTGGFGSTGNDAL